MKIKSSKTTSCSHLNLSLKLEFATTATKKSKMGHNRSKEKAKKIAKKKVYWTLCGLACWFNKLTLARFVVQYLLVHPPNSPRQRATRGSSRPSPVACPRDGLISSPQRQMAWAGDTFMSVISCRRIVLVFFAGRVIQFPASVVTSSQQC